MIRALKEVNQDLVASSGIADHARILVSINEETQKYERLDLPTIPDYFVASFSGVEDDLGMWRGYSKKSAGYAIGFRTQALYGLAGPPKFDMFPPRFNEMGYVEKEAIRQMKRGLLDGIERGWDLFCGSDISNLARYILFKIGSTFKDPKFSGEAEWRLWIDPGYKNLHFRATSSFAVPFTKIPLAPSTSPIARVIVGPTAHPQLSQKSVTLLLETTGWGRVPVIPSKVPYRD